jgi:hypothetical protein
LVLRDTKKLKRACGNTKRGIALQRGQETEGQ